MKKTLDFNKMKKAHTAKKKWEELQEEQLLEKTNQNSSKPKKEANSTMRKTS